MGIDDLSGGHLANVPSQVEFLRVDLADGAAVRSHVPKGCHAILHLAGQSSGEISFDDPVADIYKNTVSTLNLIRYGIENRSERIVYTSARCPRFTAQLKMTVW